MHNRAIVLAVFSCSCLLSACGGGGGGSPSITAGIPGGSATDSSGNPQSGSQSTAKPATAPPAMATPAPPTPTPAAYPYAAGNTFVYAGQLAQTYQSFQEIVAPGTATPEPVASTLVDVAQTVTVKAGQTFNGVGNLVGLHSIETDALASGLESTTSTTDTYEALVVNGPATQLLDYGTQYADEAGDTVSTLPNPATILDMLPEASGARWTNGPGATIDEAIAGDADGSAITVVRTVDNDGTYNEKTTYPPNYSGIGITGVGNIQENADGSGVLAIEANGGPVTLTYSPPEPQPSGSPLITVNEYASLDTTGTPSAQFQVPSWYGSAPALYAESDKDEGTVTIPTTCKLAAAFPAQGTALVQTIAKTDTILGYNETQTTTSYVAPGYGLLCATFADKITAIYDFTGDEPFVFTMVPPLEITTSAQTLALQAGSVIAGSTTSARRLTLESALRARFDRSIRAARAHRLGELMRRAIRLRARGAIR